MEGFILIVGIITFVAWIISIDMFIQAAKEKGYHTDGGTGKLFFVGLFASPLVLGLYTASLPDKSVGAAAKPTGQPASHVDELPDL